MIPFLSRMLGLVNWYLTLTANHNPLLVFYGVNHWDSLVFLSCTFISILKLLNCQIILTYSASNKHSWLSNYLTNYSLGPSLESHLWAARVLRNVKKSGWKKVSGIRVHLYILVLNEMWVEWVSGRWDPINIYGKSEPGLLFADALKWKNGTPIRGWREYLLKSW